MTPIVLWFLTLWRYPGGDLLHAFLYNNNFQRFLRSSEGYFGGHEQPWFYYFFQFPEQFFPWVIVLALGIRWFWSERRETASKFILSWFIPGFVLLTLAGTKRGSYLLPILPPLAIWIAAWFVRRRHERWLTLAGATFTLSFVLVSLFVVPQVNELKSLRPFGRELSAQLTPATQLYGYRTDETTRAIVPFYTGHYLKPLERESDLASLANRKEEVAIVVLEQPDRPLVAEVKKFFPYAWIAHDKGDVRHMWVLSNVKKRQT